MPGVYSALDRLWRLAAFHRSKPTRTREPGTPPCRVGRKETKAPRVRSPVAAAAATDSLPSLTHLGRALDQVDGVMPGLEFFEPEAAGERLALFRTAALYYVEPFEHLAREAEFLCDQDHDFQRWYLAAVCARH